MTCPNKKPRSPPPLPPSTKLPGWAKTILTVLKPSFLKPQNSKQPLRKITPTTYLNGVRGLAASLVYIQHLLYAHWLHAGYSISPPNNHLIQLPIIRLLFSGRFMVSIFFILSGYVLSYKPLLLARSRSTTNINTNTSTSTSLLYTNLSSSAFRRTPRLFLPLIPAMIATALAIQLTCYGAENFSRDACTPRASSLWRQILNYVPVLAHMLDPSAWAEYYPPGLPHLWTLPMEFRGSMVVFLLVLGLGNSIPVFRFGILVLFALGFLYLGRWEVFLFVCGPILAELRIWRDEKKREFDRESAFVRKPIYSDIARVGFWTGMFISGLFLGSWPAFQACSSMGFRHFCVLTPSPYKQSEVTQQYFWISVGAFLLLLSFENLEALQKPFTTRLALYMGDISFGFYIVHWTMLFTVGTVIIGWCKGVLPYGGTEYSLGFFVGAVLTTPCVVWVGDVYWRLFDDGAVRCARWLDARCGTKGE
ncbi:hypothetical protein VTL71DRAFT_4843 [Oculimacula yallundae]|uniref:Acyltransferase 3 domain-containing protein n=1 Tax=Oculimacula yallundae TaxID=86028 RepID=A0ABR4C353_9HELO